MRFWDSSAIVPLFVEEPASARCRALVRSDNQFVVWLLARTEVLSALRRRLQDHRLDDEDYRQAKAKLEQHAARWRVVSELAHVRDHADDVVHRHALRTLDASQLAAAIVAVKGKTKRREFVVGDGPLADAAGKEGFAVVRVT